MGDLRNYLNCTCHDNIKLRKAEPSNSLVNEYTCRYKEQFSYFYKIQNDDLSQLKKDNIKKKLSCIYHLADWFLFWHEMKNRFRPVNNCMFDAHHLRSTKKRGGVKKMSGKLKNNSYSLVLPSSMEVEFTLTWHKTFVSSSSNKFFNHTPNLIPCLSGN